MCTLLSQSRLRNFKLLFRWGALICPQRETELGELWGGLGSVGLAPASRKSRLARSFWCFGSLCFFCVSFVHFLWVCSAAYASLCCFGCCFLLCFVIVVVFFEHLL